MRTFVLEMAPDGTQVARTVTDEESQTLFEATVAFWRSWLRAAPTAAAGARRCAARRWC